MKIEEIAKIEDASEDAIILIKEALFWRAYERSAKRFVYLITKYQLIRKEFKALGRSMVYLGFPETRLKHVIARAKIKGWPVEESVSGQIRITGIPSIPGFDGSELTIKTISKPDDQTPHLSLRLRSVTGP